MLGVIVANQILIEEAKRNRANSKHRWAAFGPIEFVGSITGRLASHKPAMRQIDRPSPTKEGATSTDTVPEGPTVITGMVNYSELELRLLATFLDDPEMERKVITHGSDRIIDEFIDWARLKKPTPK